MKTQEQDVQVHNREQVDYFSSKVKPTMVPEDTPYIVRQIDELLAFGNIGPGNRVLDVGCGMGRYTLNIAGRGINIEGLDLTPFLLEKLNEYNNGRYNIPLHCADIIDHPEEMNGRYDAVIGFFTLHHLHNIPVCYQAMAKMVKPGGSILFLEPNAYNPLYYIQVAISPGMKWKGGDEGIVDMRRSVVFDAMKSAGLTDLQLKRFGFFPPFLANRSWGQRLEIALEKFPVWGPMLPFQIFKGSKPGHENSAV